MGSVGALLFRTGLIAGEVVTEVGLLMSLGVRGAEVIADWCLTTESQAAIITVTTGEVGGTVKGA